MNKKELGKKLGKQLREALEPIVQRKALDINSKHLYFKNIKDIADNLVEALESEFSPLTDRIKFKYQFHQVNEVIDKVTEYQNRGFYISDSNTATSEKEGFYELTKKNKNYEIPNSK